MFKKLKEKITEEVKSSPQRFQQLTQSVSDRLQNASTSDENFFSIGEDDANTSSNAVESEFTNVALMLEDDQNVKKNSSSPVPSDISFLQRYESFTNLYHLQSDLEISASEIEDSASNSSQLGHLSKEQIYTAFQKAQMRYHKYRGRYTDLAKHYKNLEKENSKMKSVLVETQDKAIRRITELKEQCTLEQKAKAHLESALRDEIDEKQMKIQSLQMKTELLQNSVNPSPDPEIIQNLNKYLTDARQEIETLNERMQEMKANAIIFQTREYEYKTKISTLEKEVSLFHEREKENNLSLAQNKMELHNEILKKDDEISNLKKDNEVMRKKFDTITSGNNKLENLQIQNKKLIDKLENLSLKCNSYENELLKIDQYKIEIQSLTQINNDLKTKIKELEGNLHLTKEDAKKSLLNLEGKVQQKLQQEFETKDEEEVKHLKETNKELLQQLTTKTTKFKDLETIHLELIEDGVLLRSKICSLEEELAQSHNDRQVCELKIVNLETNLQKTKQIFEDLTDKAQSLQNENNVLSQLEMKHNQCLQDEVKSEIELILGHFSNSKERKLLEIMNGEQSNRKVPGRNNMNFSEELKDFRTILLQYEEALEQRKNDLDSEAFQMRQELESKNNAMKIMEEETSNLNKELKDLKKQCEKVDLLETELQNSVKEKNQLLEKLQSQENDVKKLIEENIRELKETSIKLKCSEREKKNLSQDLSRSFKKIEEIEAANRQLILQVQHSEEKFENLTSNLENKHRIEEDEIKTLKVDNAHLEAQISQLKNCLQSDKFEEKTAQLAALKESLTNQNEEIDYLKAHLLKNSKLLQLKDESLSLELNKSEEERRQFVEEVTLLKELLETANTNLIKQEDELKHLKTSYSDCQEKIKSLSTEVEDYRQIEQKLSRKNSMHEHHLKLKDSQLDDISRKLEEYSDLVLERNENILKIVPNFPGENCHNFSQNRMHKKSLQNLEEKLQNFEKTFSIENENLTSILTYLKHFEENCSVKTLERNQLENDKEQLLKEIERLQCQVQELISTRILTAELDEKVTQLKNENGLLVLQDQQMSQNILELQSRNAQLVLDNNFVSEENTGLIVEIEELKLKNKNVKDEYERSQLIINDLKAKITKLESVKENIEKDHFGVLEEHISQLHLENQLLKDEIKEQKSSLSNSNMMLNENESQIQEIENLKIKLTQYKSLDLTNQSSIEFYENELQKLKNQNEKLNRKLDETLVTLHHCSELSHSTEIEYLKNVLYNYMLGKESLVLARVIAAVCKFDPHQTATVLAKEREKQTLLGQLGII